MGTISSLGTIVNPGLITGIVATPSSGIYTEPVTGCGGLTGATLNIAYGVVLERLTPGTGLYNANGAPSCTVSNPGSTTSSDSGTGLTLSCTIYSSTVSFGTDNAPAFRNAINLMNQAAAAGSPKCIYVPAGNYLTSVVNTLGSSGTSMTMAQGYGCFLGDEHYHSNIFIIPNTAGDLFAWNDSNNNGSSIPFGNTQTFSDLSQHPNKGGSAVRYMTILGDRASTAEQNALAFYGPTSDLLIDDLRISYVKGRAIAAGLADTSNTGNLANARISNVYLDVDGDFAQSTGAPVAALDIGATGGPGSSGIDLLNLRFYDNFGTSLWLHAGPTATSNTRRINILTAKGEESGFDSVAPPPPNSIGDMVLLGDPNAGSFDVSDILGRGLELVNQAPYYPFLHIAGAAAPAAPAARFDLQFFAEAAGATGFGSGLQVDSCQQCAFHAITNNANGSQLQVGTLSGTVCVGANLLAPGLTYDGGGAAANQ